MARQECVRCFKKRFLIGGIELGTLLAGKNGLFHVSLENNGFCRECAKAFQEAVNGWWLATRSGKAHKPGKE